MNSVLSGRLANIVVGLAASASSTAAVAEPMPIELLFLFLMGLQENRMLYWMVGWPMLQSSWPQHKLDPSSGRGIDD